MHEIRSHAIERLCKKAIDQIAQIQRLPHLSKYDAYLIPIWCGKRIVRSRLRLGSRSASPEALGANPFTSLADLHEAPEVNPPCLAQDYSVEGEGTI